MNKNIILLVAILTVLTACNKTDTNTNIPSGNYATAPATPEQQKLLDLVNNARTSGHQCGSTYYPPAPTVTWNSTLTTAAQKHSDYMSTNNNLSHTGSNGSSAGDRITAEGYNWSTYGENIAVGFATEEAVVKGWLESEGHCKNIMNPNFTEMGIATSGAYWTQVFAAP